MSRIKPIDTPYVGKTFKDRLRVRFHKSVDSDGNYHYKRVSDCDIQEDIQSYKDTCCLTSILSRYLNCPPETIISQVNNTETFSGDFSNMPSDLSEFVRLCNKCRDDIPNFDELMNSGGISAVISSLTEREKNTPIKEDSSNGENE